MKKPHAKSDELVRGFEPVAVLDELQGYLDRMAALFCYVDGDAGCDDSHRGAFNEAAAQATAHVDLLRDILDGSSM